MSVPPLSALSVLQHATPAQLELAAADNHRQLFILEAMSVKGAVQSAGGLTWAYAGPHNNASVPFPAMSKEEAGPLLDEMMAWFRSHPPRGAGCWSLDPPQPADLGVRLLARGFQPGWNPCWMALRLDNLRQYPVPAGLEVRPDNHSDTSLVSALPYAGKDGAVPPALMEAFPDRAQRFLAFLDGRIVGQSCVFLTSGTYGAAGIYNVGVVPSARQQGIGKAILYAACQHAAVKGWHYAVLNATGLRMYQQAGFKWISNGHTWWINNQDCFTDAPLPARIQLAEAIGLGDIRVLEEIGKDYAPQELNIPLANGMTLMELAVYFHQSRAAAWLAEHGATCTVLDAWNLGWKDRAKALLAAHPEEVNRRYSYLDYTILHIAAEKNDLDLAQLALSANPNLNIRDKIYHSTPLGWAEHFGRMEIIQLINKHLKV
ncbi:GNAT family N-acetyltransferase [uncultured Chitinophaga sp.]|mgnify:CR=1 FL=1|jgi:Predicted acetyltransferase|uniref:GNAT family N-acetyltransferase n=1 Tax=uncultured Chitinophaga sp. TaxID=339340 RepID=UPI00263128A4|nr:GNAT family N-acetyltransferase [uncultured Chitinophaga sp.]